MDSLVAVRRSLFWVSAPIFFINFALPVKSKELGASAFEVGGLFSLFTLSLLLFRPLVGYALDHYGRRWFFCLSLGLYALAYFGYTLASDIHLMYAARFLQGVGAALLLLSVDAITTDLTGQHDRATALGKNLEAQTRSTFVGATLGFGLVAALPALGWTISFAIFTALALFAFWKAWRYVPETVAVDISKSGFVITAPMMRLMIWLVPVGFASALIMPIYLVYLSDTFTTDKRFLSWAFLPAGLVFALLPAKLGQLVDRFGPNQPLLIALAALLILYCLMPQWHGFWLVVAIYTLSSVAWALIEPARKALTARVAGTNVAQGYGLAEMAFGAGAVLGPLAGGYVYDHYQHSWPFYLNAVAILLALVLLLLLVQPALRGLSNHD